MIKIIIYEDAVTCEELYSETFNDTPICSKDFCDNCGDCLACEETWETKCLDDKDHMWVEYVQIHGDKQIVNLKFKEE